MKRYRESSDQRRGVKEFFRKRLVSLKRSPQNIPFVALIAAFVVYSLNLTSIANTTAMINTANMGQCEFAAMLFSILAFVCFLRAFPKRQPVNKLMLVLLFVMFAILIFADVVYASRITEAVSRADNPIVLSPETAYVSTSYTVVTLHIILVIVCAVLVALLPLYGGFLKSLNTSIDVEGNEGIDEIDISDDD